MQQKRQRTLQKRAARMSTLAEECGSRGKAMLTFTSPCVSSWLLPGPEPSPPTSSQLYSTDETTSWARGTECWRHSSHFPYTSWGIQWEVGDFQPDSSYPPNGGERKVWIIGQSHIHRECKNPHLPPWMLAASPSLTSPPPSSLLLEFGF